MEAHKTYDLKRHDSNHLTKNFCDKCKNCEFGAHTDYDLKRHEDAVLTIEQVEHDDSLKTNLRSHDELFKPKSDILDWLEDGTEDSEDALNQCQPVSDFSQEKEDLVAKTSDEDCKEKDHLTHLH